MRLALAEGLWPALAEPSQIEDVILDLAVNARDAMPNGGKLVIETADAGLRSSTTRRGTARGTEGGCRGGGWGVRGTGMAPGNCCCWLERRL